MQINKCEVRKNQIKLQGGQGGILLYKSRVIKPKKLSHLLEQIAKCIRFAKHLSVRGKIWRLAKFTLSLRYYITKCWKNSYCKLPQSQLMVQDSTKKLKKSNDSQLMVQDSTIKSKNQILHSDWLFISYNKN